MEKSYKEIDNKDGSITLVPKDSNFGKIFPFGEQESWDEIFEKHWKECEHNHMTNFQDWLTQNYNPPTKK